MQLVFDSCPDLRDHFQIINDLLHKTMVQHGQEIDLENDSDSMGMQWKGCGSVNGYTRYRVANR